MVKKKKIWLKIRKVTDEERKLKCTREEERVGEREKETEKKE